MRKRIILPVIFSILIISAFFFTFVSSDNFNQSTSLNYSDENLTVSFIDSDNLYWDIDWEQYEENINVSIEDLDHYMLEYNITNLVGPAFKFRTVICNQTPITNIDKFEYNPSTSVWTNTGSLDYVYLINYGVPSSWCADNGNWGYLVFANSADDRRFRLNFTDEYKTIKLYTGTATEIVASETTNTYGKMKLMSHSSVQEVKQVGLGSQVVMWYDFDFNKKLNDGLGTPVFTNMDTGLVEDRNWSYVQLVNESYSQDTYECGNETTVNGTEWVCNVNGSITLQREVWEPYTSTTIPKGISTIGIKVYNEQGDYFDGVWEVGGLLISEHATWTASLNTDLVSYYKLDELSGLSAYDSLGTNNGSTSGATVNVTGKINTAYSFDGSADWVNTGSTMGINPNGEFTFALWFKHDTINTTQVMFGSRQTSDGHAVYLEMLDDGKIRNSFYDGDLNAYVTSTSNYDDNLWHHLVMVQNATSTILYMDGSSVGTPGTAMTNFNALTSYFYIGAYNNANGGNGTATSVWNGQIDEVGCWNRTLSGGEVTQLYNGGTGITYTTEFNTAPTIIANATAPDDVYTNTNFIVNATPSDADAGDTLTVYGQAWVDDVEVGGEHASVITNATNDIVFTLLSGNFSKGEEIKVTLWVGDGTANSTAFNTTAETVLNSAPTAPTSALMNESSIYTNDAIECVVNGSTDADSDSITYWYKFNDTAGTLQDYSTSSEFSCTTAGCDKGDTVYCWVKATTTDANSTEYNDDSISILNSIPTTPTDLTLNTSVLVGEDLWGTCSDSTDADSDAITYWYEFYNNNDTSLLQDYTPTQSYTIQLTDAHDEIRVRCKAVTSDANSSTYDEETIIVSNTAPTSPTLNAPTDDAVDQLNNVLLDVSISDVDGDNMNVSFHDASDNSTICNNNTNIASGSNVLCTWEGLTDLTDYEWYVNVTDGTDIVLSNEWNFSVGDNTAPNIEIIYPLNNSYSNVSELNFTSTDVGGVEACWFSNDSGLTNSSTDFSCLNLTGLISIEGLNNWTIFTNDTSGNENSSTIYFTVDNTPPTITINSPPLSATTDPVLISITTNEISQACNYSMDNNINISLATSNNLTFQASITNPNDGSHDFRFYCVDSVGNENSTSLLNVIFSYSVVSGGGGGTGGFTSTIELDKIIIETADTWVIGKENRIKVYALDSNNESVILDSLEFTIFEQQVEYTLIESTSTDNYYSAIMTILEDPGFSSITLGITADDDGKIIVESKTIQLSTSQPFADTAKAKVNNLIDYLKEDLVIVLVIVFILFMFIVVLVISRRN